MLSYVSDNNPFIVSFFLGFSLLFFNICKSVAFRWYATERRRVKFAVDEIIRGGGEGVILRYPNSCYESGRSLALYKLKVHREDKEALVTKVESNEIHLRTYEIITICSLFNSILLDRTT